MKKCTAKCWIGPNVSGKPSLVAPGAATAITSYANAGNIISDADFALLDPTTAATFFTAATIVEGPVFEQVGTPRYYMKVSAA